MPPTVYMYIRKRIFEGSRKKDNKRLSSVSGSDSLIPLFSFAKGNEKETTRRGLNAVSYL